jgi:WD40 repeat protein
MSALPIQVPNGFYVAGGTMRPDALSYVCRNADEELYTGLMENEFCHVLTARQMGKSSLMLRTAARLREAGVGVAALDLTGIGTNLSPEQWYSGLIVQLGDRLDLEDELLEFWTNNTSFGPMQRWIGAIRKVILPLHPGRLAIFVDEIDAVASLSFSADEFFSGIRECYNLRNEDADMNHLTFCLLGVASPFELIRDTRTTPFNVGRRIALTDFTEEEALPLAAGLGRSPIVNRALLNRILYWTNGHPYLTQRLCKVVSEHHTDRVHGIDESIEEMFFSKRAQTYDDNLVFVRERLLRSGVDVVDLLNFYSRVWRGKRVADDDSHALINILRLSGITRAENGWLYVRNRIYERVFNDEWVKANLPGAEIRRQRAAFRRGVIRTTAVAAVLLAIITILALIALRQRNLAREQTALNNQLLYAARMKLAKQEYDNSNIARVEELVKEATPDAGDKDLRSFEWYLFWRYAHSEALRLDEPGHIASARFFANDNTIAIAEVIHTMVRQKREYLIKFYDRKLLKEITSFAVPAGTNFDMAIFSPDNKYLATDAPDNSVTVWELSSKQARKLPGPGNPVISLAFSPDQHSVGAGFIQGRFRIWDWKSGTQKFEGQSKLERPGVTFSPDGKLVAVGTDDNVVTILNAETGKSLRSFSFVKGTIGLIFFSPDGSKLFATTYDGNIYWLSLRDWRLLNINGNHANEVMSYSFSPDGKTLATGSVDRTLKLWDIATGTLLRTIVGHGGWVTSLHFSADGRQLLSGDVDGLIKLWNLDTKEMPVWPDAKPDLISATAFTPQNELIAIGRAHDGNLKLWDLSNGRILADLGIAQTVSSAAFSKDASLLAIAVAPAIKIYSVATGKQLSTPATNARDVYSLEFSPDGTRLLSGNRQGNVIISEVSSGRMEVRLDSGNMYYRAVFSPDGKQVASADQDGKIRIWDVASVTIEQTLIGHTGVVRFMCFSPDGQLLATSGEDNTVRMWDLASGKEVSPLIHSDYVERLAFTPDGKRLLTASYGGRVVLWDVVGMQEVITLRRGGGGSQSSISFSKDGLILAISSESGAVTVWQGGPPLSQPYGTNH